MLNKSSYLVLNYNTSPVSIRTRHSSELIPAGDDKSPSSVPLSLDDIVYANNSGNAFKCGLLRFEPEYEEEIYNELRIANWKDILTNKELYDIILDPDMDGLQRLIDISDPMYFDRVYGAFVGLKNDGATISTKVDEIMRIRRNELKEHKKISAIHLTKKSVSDEDPRDAKIAQMEAQMEAMQKLLEQLSSASTADVKPKKKSPGRGGAKTAAKEDDSDPVEEVPDDAESNAKKV